MGVCCSKLDKFGGDRGKEEDDEEEEGYTYEGDFGARVRRLQRSSSCNFASMFTKQGKKGINQDAITIWEDFCGEDDVVFCGVFDGHGPLGHKVSNYVCDVLPSKLSLELKSSRFQDYFEHNSEEDTDDEKDKNSGDSDDNQDDSVPISSWKASFIKAFREMDEQLKHDSTLDAFCSGTTAVTILKQGEHLMIANLGDSRAILCTRNDNNKQPVPVQLTVDLKPNNPSEAERINRCNGRVFALEEEEDVYRIWLPNEDTPGLAMARAFGDFCLKDFGLISIPEVSYRKISSNDEFVVLATDGIWDVLSNKEVVQIVTSTKNQSKAAKALVNRAVRAWRSKYPTSKVDDCAAICLFLNRPQSSSSFRKSITNVNQDSVNEHNKDCGSSKTLKRDKSNENVESTNGDDESEEWNALEGVSRVNTVVKLPRFPSGDNWQRRSIEDEDEIHQAI